MSETVKAELVSRKEMFNDKWRFAEFKYTYFHDGKESDPTLNIITADYKFEAVWKISRSYRLADDFFDYYYCKWDMIELEEIDKKFFSNFTIQVAGGSSEKGAFDPHCLPFKKDLKQLDYFQKKCRVILTIQINYEDETVDSVIDIHDKFLQNKDVSDVTIVVGDEEFPACRNILSLHSDVFAKMFESDMLEKKTGRVEIVDVDPAIFKLFLRFIYCGKLDRSDINELLELILIADKYSVRSLVSFCGYRISNNLNVNNVIDVFITADRVKEECLKNNCMDFIIKNKDEVVGTENFKNMVKTNLDLFVELFSRIKVQL